MEQCSFPTKVQGIKLNPTFIRPKQFPNNSHFLTSNIYVPRNKAKQVSYWFNQVESSISIDGHGLTLAKWVTQEASYKTRVRSGPKQGEHKSMTGRDPHTDPNY